MAKVSFTENIQRHVRCPPMDVPGTTLREALDEVFLANPAARSYVLDDQGAIRKHMTVFIDGTMVRDRVRLADPVSETSEIYVFQALSGG